MAGQRDFRCDECDYNFKTKGTLKIHVQSFHEKLRHSCNQCDKQFTQTAGLKKHKQAVHENVKYPCSC